LAAYGQGKLVSVKEKMGQPFKRKEAVYIDKPPSFVLNNQTAE
jgi:hypothetical protein